MSITYYQSRITLVLLLASTIVAHAQDYRPGFIVTAKGDSIVGLIANRSTKKNAIECHFKPSKKSPVMHYHPQDLKSYGIYGFKRYVSTGNIAHDKKTEWKFLEVLVNGKISLLADRRMFYVKKDTITLLPKPIKKKINTGTKTFSKTDQRYIGFLNIAMADCKMTVGQPTYREDQLIKAIIQYNECTGTSSEEIKRRIPKNKITWSILSGIDLAHARFDADVNYGGHIPIKDFQINQSISVPAGIGMEWSNPSKHDKRYVGIELWYDKKFFQGYAETSVNGNTLRSDLLMSVSYLKLPVNMRFNLRQEKNTPYVRAGYVHYFPLSSTSKYRDEYEANGVISTTLDVTTIKKKAANGFWVAAGYSHLLSGKIAVFFEGRYELNDGFTNPIPSSHSSNNTINFLAGLKF